MDDNIYTIINKLSNLHLLSYIFMIFIIIITISNIEIKLNHIIGLLLSYMIILYIIKKDNIQFDEFMNNIDNKLKFLDKILLNPNNTIDNETIIMDDSNIITKKKNKSYLYTNPLIVNLLYNIKEYRYYNPSAYRQLIININNLIKLSRKKNKSKCKYDILMDYKNNALNNLHSIIHNIPSNTINNIKYKTNITALHKLLQEYMTNYKNKVNKKCDDTCDVNIMSSFIYDDMPSADNTEIKYKLYNNHSINNGKTAFNYYI
jgi:hypothetical protein